MALFKKALHQLLGKEGCSWVVEGGDVFCAMLQAESAKVRSNVTSGKGTTNVVNYQKKGLQTAFTHASVTTPVLLELIANRETVLGAVENLASAHAVLDAKRLMLVNRTVVRVLYDAVYSNDCETPASSVPSSRRHRLPRSSWANGTDNCRFVPLSHGHILAVYMYGRLAHKFEGMADMINGA